MRTDKSYMIVIPHFKIYPALFPLKWLICIPNISAVRGNVVFETLHDFYRTAIPLNIGALYKGRLLCLACSFCSSDQMFAAGFLQVSPHDGPPYLGLCYSRN